MPRTHLTPAELQELHALAAQWGKSIPRCTGDDAIHFDLSALESIDQAAAAGLVEGTLQCLLQLQADALADQQPCPACGHLCPLCYEDRTLHVQGGLALPYREPVCHCPDCPRDFFPLRPRLHLDGHGYSPTVLEQIVTAARLDSFADAAFAVGLTGLSISPRHVQQLTGETAKKSRAGRKRSRG
jgi:hypothetical protein